MNTKLLLAIASCISISVATSTTVAAPLPVGTKLTIEKTTDAYFVGPVPGCTNGSCYGLYLFAGLFAWTPLGPGTDGGLIIGKGQKSGGQEIDPLSSANGELTDVWSTDSGLIATSDYVGNNGTFFTAPDSTDNIFDDVSCSRSGCFGKTELKVWNAAWGGVTIPMGSASGCDKTKLPACTVDGVDAGAGIFVRAWTIDPAGMSPRKYRLIYNQVVPTGWPNYPIELVLTGEVITAGPQPVVTVIPANLTGFYGFPIPFTINAADPDGAALTCRVGAAPANGVAVLTGCAAGTYTANFGFIGIDSFTVIANNGLADSAPATVNAAVTAPISIDYKCILTYPVTQTTLTGKQGHLSITVTGNLISVNPNGKEIKICPATTATHAVSTTTPNATVVCKVKSNTTRSKGHVKVNDHIKCTDKPIGNDKLSIKIKSGVNQKVM